MEAVKPKENMLKPNRMLFFNIYNILLSVIMVSIFAGIIIDKFVELRKLEQRMQYDMNTRCYICGLKSYLLYLIIERFLRG